jgi:type IV pilus assembly protein PilV
VNRFATIRRGGRQQGGFSLLEVLIALVVLAVGLLGLALMQTLNLHYTKTAEQRTKAVNLAGAMLDIMRTNRSQASGYVIAPAEFAGVSAAGGCASDGTLDAETNRTRWMCEVREALGPAATATVTYDGGSGAVYVHVEWAEDRVRDLIAQNYVELETVL